MTTGRTGGGTGLGCGVGTGGGLATGGSPPSNRRNSSSQSLVAAGRGAAGREVVEVVERRDSASSDEPVSSGGFFFLSHSTMIEPMAIATRIQNFSMSPRIGMLVAPDIARIRGKVGVIDFGQLPDGFVCEPAPPGPPPAPAMLSRMHVSAWMFFMRS